MPEVYCFQRETSHLFSELEFPNFYLDDMLMHANGNEQNHINKISTLMERFQKHNLKVKVSK